MVRGEWPGFNFPIQTIYCVGRNFAAHAKELGNSVPEAPIIFLKPFASLVGSGVTVEWPLGSQQIDPEVECVFGLTAGGKHLTPQAARKLVGAVAVGIDLTARDWQDAAKKKGFPWTRAKGFDGAAVLSSFSTANADGVHRVRLWVDDELRQDGSTEGAIFDIGTVLSYLSQTLTLHAGDIVYFGTPPGVAPVQPGQTLRAQIDDGETVAITLSQKRNA